MASRRGVLSAFGSVLAAPALAAQGSSGGGGGGGAWRPTRPVRLIVTYPPGGVNDIVGRIIAEPLGGLLGQPVVVENRAGAGGNIGMAVAAREAPDGHAILFGTTAMFGVNPVMYADSGFDAVRDFTCLGSIGEVANVLSVIPRRVEAGTVAALVAEARRRPLVYGSVGNGSSSHMSAVAFCRAAGIEATHVPYRGSSPLVASMLAGDVDFGFDTTATSTAHIRSGAFRALGVTTTRRASALPEVPTLAEAGSETGLAGYDLGIWFGLFVPAATPEPVRAALGAALERARGTPDTAERLRRAFVDPLVVPAAELQPWWRGDAARWQNIARGAGIRAD